MHLGLQDSLALGVIFAATDSVAVLQVLRPDRAPLLYSLVFGEGVINDATAVALLRAVQVTSGPNSNVCLAPHNMHCTATGLLSILPASVWTVRQTETRP